MMVLVNVERGDQETFPIFYFINFRIDKKLINPFWFAFLGAQVPLFGVVCIEPYECQENFAMDVEPFSL